MSALDRIDWSQLEILFKRSIIHAQFNDLSAQRIEFRNEEFLQFFLEEVSQDLGALIISVLAYSLHHLRSEECLSDILSVYLHLIKRISEQRTSCRNKV